MTLRERVEKIRQRQTEMLEEARKAEAEASGLVAPVKEIQAYHWGRQVALNASMAALSLALDDVEDLTETQIEESCND